jgi:glycosyltransferase involved in cell wall biosynthesis
VSPAKNDPIQAGRLLFCSKSEWSPPIRREHAWARLAVQHGHDVVFVERPRDIRAVRTQSLAAYAHGLFWGESDPTIEPGITVTKRATLLPGHRSPTAARLNHALLRSVLRREASAATSLVCSWPWDWSAVGRTAASRRVFDMADDWGELMPRRREWFDRYYRHIAAEADEIIVVSPDLRRHFPGRTPIVIRNGVFQSMLEPATVTAAPRTMIYVGTLTHRFDAPLMDSVLSALPNWDLDIVGGCSYPGLGSEPAAELQRLLERHGRRITWHGQVPRQQVLPLLDRAAVAVVPNRPKLSLGQDSMKFYDYAARGRTIVSTRWFDPDQLDHPPYVLTADDPPGFAEAILQAAADSESATEAQRHWAFNHTWNERWPAWSRAVFGPTAGIVP